MLKVCLAKFLAVTIGLAAIFFAADLILFTFGTWNGWKLVQRWVEDADLEWWKSSIGPLPDPATPKLAGPHGISGRPATWFGAGGPGSDGASVIPGLGRTGLTVYSIQTAIPLIYGRAMASESQYGFGIGVRLPCVALERTYSEKMTVMPPHPGAGGWHTIIHPWSAIANIGILVAVIGGPLFIRDAIAMIRIARGQCSRCGHILLTEQDRCPECGSLRRHIL